MKIFAASIFTVLVMQGILAQAAESDQKAHVDAVVAVLEKAGGTYERAGDSLKMVNRLPDNNQYVHLRLVVLKKTFEQIYLLLL